MGSDNDMKDGGVLDPYTGMPIQKKSKAQCMIDSSGIVICRDKSESYIIPFIAAIIGIMVIVFLFSIRIDVVTEGNNAIDTVLNPSIYSLLLIPILAITVGVGIAILYTKSN